MNSQVSGSSVHWSTHWSRTSGTTELGRRVTEERTVPPFAAVAVESAATVTVRIGAAPKLTVSAEDTVLRNLRTEVRGDVLQITAAGSYSSSQGPLIEITTPTLNAVDLAGAGKVTVMGLNADRFRATIRGTGSITAAGHADSLKVEIGGSGTIAMADLTAGTATASITGAGTIDLAARRTLDASIAGSGSIRYGGSPQVTRRISGAGVIRPR